MATARYVLPVPAGPHAEGHGIFDNGADIRFLAQRLWPHRTALGCDGNKISCQVLHARFIPAAGQRDAVTHRLFFQRRTACPQHQHGVQRPAGTLHILFSACQLHLGAAAYGRYAKGLLQQTDVLIAISKNGKCRIH